MAPARAGSGRGAAPVLEVEVLEVGVQARASSRPAGSTTSRPIPASGRAAAPRAAATRSSGVLCRALRLPPSGLSPAAAATASTTVDLPLPFSPTRNVTLGRQVEPVAEQLGHRRQVVRPRPRVGRRVRPALDPAHRPPVVRASGPPPPWATGPTARTRSVSGRRRARRAGTRVRRARRHTRRSSRASRWSRARPRAGSSGGG